MLFRSTVAATPGARGVLCMLAGQVLGPADVRKHHPYRVDAFDSGDAGPLARVEEGRVLVLREWPSGTALGFDPLRFMEQVSPYVRALHISDNDGREDQNLPFTTDAWFYPLLKDFRRLPMVIEAYELDDATLRGQLDLLQKAVA